MPAHWEVAFDFQVPVEQVKAMSEKLGADLTSVRNTAYDVNGKRVQVNAIITPDSGSAEKLMTALRSMKTEEALLRKGLTIYEFVGQNDVLPAIAEGRAHLDGTAGRERSRTTKPDQAPSREPAAEKQARQAATAWLALVDKGDYAKSWDNASGYLRAAVKKDAWPGMLSPVRDPLGKVVSREFKSAEYRTSLPGAPDGEYVVIQYTTVFERKKSSVETITPMLGEDGKWRVSGYYIK
jgi:hypothetical protein